MTDIPDHNVVTIHHLVELLRRHVIEEFWNVVETLRRLVAVP